MTVTETSLISQKPIPLKIKPNEIPLSMREKKQWVGWKYEWQVKKWSKPPYQVCGIKRAKSNDPSTWSSFDEAYASYVAGRVDGIGYVFAQNDGLVGIDVDHCVDFIGAKKGFTRDEARLILLKFLPKAYIEKSVGGDGMHLIVRGEALRCGKGPGQLSFIEVYDQTSPRYLTVTGHRLPSSQQEPLPAQNELKWLNESYMAKPGQTGPRVSSLEGRLCFDAENPCVDLDEVEDMVDWLRQADSGWLWRAYGGKPDNLDTLFGQEWVEPMPSASDLDMKVFGKLAWYAVLHLRIADDAVGHTIMAVYRQWPGYRGEEGERKAQYGIKKALDSAFEERERRINSGEWKDSGYTIPEVIFTETSQSSNVVPFPEPSTATSSLYPTMPRPFPGVMEEIVAFTLKTAPKPQPNLALLSALLAMSSSCSGAYYLPIGSMRLNLYGLGIAETGAGKDQPRCVAVQVAREAGAKVIAKPASGQGLEDQLVSKTPMLVEVDEAAHLFQELNAREQGSSIVMLNAMLLKLYSASKEIYSTRAKAINSKNIASSMPRDVYNPMLNLLGSSTPEKLGEVLTSQNIADGMLGRMLFASGQSGVQPRRAYTQELPASIKEKAIRVKNASIARNPEQPEVPCIVKDIAIRETSEAEQMLDALMADFNHKAEKTDGILGKALFARSFEKCFRIAGVLAVWDDPTEPVIDVRHAEWARDFVNASDTAALQFCDGYFHGGQTQGDAAQIVKVIKKILDGKISLKEDRDRKLTKGGYVRHSLVLRLTKLDKKRFDEGLAYLEDAGQISRGQVDDAKPCGKTHKVKLLSLEEAA